MQMQRKMFNQLLLCIALFFKFQAQQKQLNILSKISFIGWKETGVDNHEWKKTESRRGMTFSISRLFFQRQKFDRSEHGKLEQRHDGDLFSHSVLLSFYDLHSFGFELPLAHSLPPVSLSHSRNLVSNLKKPPHAFFHHIFSGMLGCRFACQNKS